MKRLWINLALAFALVMPVIQVAAQEEAPTDELGDGAYVQKGFDYYDEDVRVNAQLGSYTNVASEGPILTASRIINFLLSLMGAFTLCLVVYAGYVWMMARGNEEEVTKAKDILIGSVIGILIILASYSIIGYVFNAFVDITD